MLRLALHLPTRCVFLTVALLWPALARSELRAQEDRAGAAGDTVRVDKALLARALARPNACRSPDAGRGLWSDPPMMMQVGRSSIHRNGRVTVMDPDAGAVRLFAPDGRELARLGRDGSGPGEFLMKNSILLPWAGDTVAVHDFRNARISLFTSAGFALALALAPIRTLTVSGPMGTLDDGSIVFGTGVDPEAPPPDPVRFRPAITLVRWRRGAGETELVRSGIPGPEWHPVRSGDRQGAAAANLGRTTSFGVAGDLIVIYDNARPAIELIDRHGRTVRVTAFEVVDPPVSARDRDTVGERLDAARRRGPVPPVLEQFPATRAAALWSGVDAAGGIWLAVHRPAAAGSVVHLRITPAGALDRCYRSIAGSRALAFGRDQVPAVAEKEAGDLINLERTVPYPSRP
jgi:hypothetical protein